MSGTGVTDRAAALIAAVQAVDDAIATTSAGSGRDEVRCPCCHGVIRFDFVRHRSSRRRVQVRAKCLTTPGCMEFMS